MQPATVLTIAGSDSGGGAGLQADLKAFALNGVFGTSVVTVLTAQNSAEIRSIEKVPASFVKDQLDAVLADLPVAAVKTGMLNVTCTPGLWLRFRKVVRLSNALVIRGILESSEGVLNLRADHVQALAMPTRSSSRDFR